MPKTTFFNLSEDKQKKIIEAAHHEFSKVEFNKASINQIIQEASISRGSFYMYFEDKYDLLYYMLGSYLKEMKQGIVNTLLLTNGNLHEMLLTMHEEFYQMYQRKDIQDFVKHMALFIQSESGRFEERFEEKQPFKEALNRLIPLIDTKQFFSNEEKDVRSILDIAFAVLKSSLVNSFKREMSYQESREHFIEYLTIIENGYIRK